MSDIRVAIWSDECVEIGLCEEQGPVASFVVRLESSTPYARLKRGQGYFSTGLFYDQMANYRALLTRTMAVMEQMEDEAEKRRSDSSSSDRQEGEDI